MSQGQTLGHVPSRRWLDGQRGLIRRAVVPEHDRDHTLAARLLGAAAGIRRQTGASVDWQEQEYLDELVGRLRPPLGDAAYDEAFAVGEAAPDAVVQEVLGISASQPLPRA